MKEQQYLRLLCSYEHFDFMLSEIEKKGFPIKSSFPIYKKDHTPRFWIFELDTIYDPKNEDHHFLINLQNNCC